LDRAPIAFGSLVAWPLQTTIVLVKFGLAMARPPCEDAGAEGAGRKPTPAVSLAIPNFGKLIQEF
jgi:hypothetical protein